MGRRHRYIPDPLPTPPIEAMSENEIARENLERTRRVYDHVFGNGTKENPGLSLRLSRVENIVKVGIGILTIFGGAVVTYAANSILNHVSIK